MKTKRMLPFLIFMALVFYVLPFWIKDMGSSIIIMLTITPVLCFACSLLCGAYNSFSLLYVLLVILLFVPAIFIYYNISNIRPAYRICRNKTCAVCLSRNKSGCFGAYH